MVLCIQFNNDYVLQQMIMSSVAMYLLTDCNDSFYGQDCKKTCGHCADDEVCNKTTGNCSTCTPGWTLPLCKESKDISVILDT